MAHRLYFQKDGDLNTTRRVCEDSLWLWIVRNYMTTFEFCMTDRKYAVATTDPVGIKGIGITSLTFDLYICGKFYSNLSENSIQLMLPKCSFRPYSDKTDQNGSPPRRRVD